MIGANITFNEKEAVTIGTYKFAYIFVSCGSKTGDWMVAAGSSFKERYTWMDRPLQIGDKNKNTHRRNEANITTTYHSTK